MLTGIEGFGNQLKFYIGVVEDNNDPIGLFRVRVRWFGIHPEDRSEVPTTSLPWSTVVMPSNSTSNSGQGISAAILPGTWVIGFMADGEEAQFSWVLGTIPTLHRPNQPGYGNGFINNNLGSTTGSSSSDTRSFGNTSGDKPYHGAPQDNPNSDGDKQINAGTYGANINTGQVIVSGTPDECAKNYPLKYYGWGPKSQNSFRCGDGTLAMHYGTAQAYELLTSKWGKKLGITSGYRSPEWNRKVGGAPNSQHMHGRAIDVNISPHDSNIEKFLQQAVESGFVGFGFYDTPSGSIWVHIDTGSGRTWQSGNVKPKAYWESVLARYGWKPGMKGLTYIKGAGQAQNNPPSASPSNSAATPVGSPTGPRMASDIFSGGDTTGIPYWMRGFKDPTNSYPSLEYRGRVSTSYAALGVNSPNGVNPKAGEKEGGRLTGFSLPNNGGTFGEPSAPYAAMYPWNKTWTTEHHQLELDDTPGAERINLEHKTGTFMEIDSNGTRVDRTVGDNHQYDAQNSYHGVVGDHNLSTNGKINSYAGTDRADHTNGSASVKIKNDNTVEISGVYSLTVGEKVKIKTSRIYIEADEVNILANSNMFLESKGTFNIKSKSLNIQTDDEMDVKTGQALKISTGSDATLKSGGKLTASSSGDASIKTGGALTMSASGAASMKGGGTTTIDGGYVNVKSGGGIAMGGTGDTNLTGGTVTLAGGVNRANPVIVVGGSQTAPAGASAGADAPDAAVAQPATDADLGDNTQIARENIDTVSTPNSSALTRPSFKSHGAYGSTGQVDDAATSAGDGSVNAPSGPSTASKNSEATGGNTDGDATIPETYGQPSSPISSSDTSLQSPAGAQKYVNDFSYKKITGGSVGQPSQDTIDGLTRASRETSFPLDLFYLFAAYESSFGNNTGSRGTILQGNSQHASDAASVYPGATGSGSYAEGLATAGYIYKYKKSVESQIGRQINRGDAYLIHFMGPGGAPVVIKNALDPSMRDQPIQPTGKLTQAAINGNGPEFFKDKARTKPRTWAEFYNRQLIKFGNGMLSPSEPKTGITSAAAGPTGPQQ